MNDIKKYNIFILISTFTRNIIELFSTIFLYKQGYSIKEIIIFFIIYYIVSFITSNISLMYSKIINSKYILILSSLLYVISFYYLSIMSNSIISLINFAILIGLSNYTYHPLRHLYAFNSLNENKNKRIASILIFNYLAIILASMLGPIITKNMKLNIVVLILLISLFISSFILFLFKNKSKIVNNGSIIKLEKGKVCFFIVEQFKVIFLLLEPLYLYIYVSSKLSYIGLFNVILGVGSIVTIYISSSYKKLCFKLLNTILVIVLLIKINIYNSTLLLIISFFEGIGIKIFEVVSTKNIYNINNNNYINYLIIVESIFCIISVIIFSIFYFINDIKVMLYICIFMIFICGFINVKIDNENEIE